MDKIKVLQIISSSNIGGAEKLFYSILKYLDKDKFEIYVACSPGGAMFENVKRYAKEIKTFNFNNWLIKLIAIFSLKRYMQEKKIDIVHTHLFNADLVGIIAATFAGVPCRIASIHGYNFSSTGEFDLRTVRNFFFSFIYRFIYIFCDSIIAACQAIKEDLTKRPGIKVRENKIKVINNAVDLKEILNCKGISNTSDTKFIGVIANLDRVKCHRVLLRAMPWILKEEEKTKFLLAGDGNEKKRLKRMVKDLKIEDNVIFLGFVDNVSDIISMCDMIVLPSLFESRPLIIMEAMALEKPVVATAVGGIPDIIENGKTGLLIPPRDPGKLKDAILYLLRNKESALEMGRRGRVKVEGFFSLKNIIEEIEKIYMRFDR